MNIRFFASGYCEAHEKIVNPLNGKGVSKFYAVWALIYLPEFGNILFDTG
ncbi:MAG: MBL fold metallo-hydrolase, partial [Runella slithyformis]